MKEAQQKFFVEQQEMGGRLDVVLQHRLGISRNHVQELIDTGRVSVNGSKRRSAYRVKSSEGIVVNITKEELQQQLSPESSVRLEVLFEGPDYVVINKPAGIAVHPKRIGSEVTLVQGLLYRYPEIERVVDPEAVNDKGDDPKLRPGIVHRLDRGVSGVMVIARTLNGFQHLKAEWKSRQVTKEYLALVYGHMPEKMGKIHSFIRRSRRHQLKMVSDPTPELGGKEALTTYTALSTWPAYQLLKVQIPTGRMHQIRLHLSSLGHPIVGDGLYGSKTAPPGLEHRMFLHSYRLVFHDLDGDPKEFVLELPQKLQDFLTQLGSPKA